MDFFALSRLLTLSGEIVLFIESTNIGISQPGQANDLSYCIATDVVNQSAHESFNSFGS